MSMKIAVAKTRPWRETPCECCTLHTNGLSFVCVRRCDSSADFCENFMWQVEHAKGFSPVCVRRCAFSDDFHKNDFAGGELMKSVKRGLQNVSCAERTKERIKNNNMTAARKGKNS